MEEIFGLLTCSTQKTILKAMKEELANYVQFAYDVDARKGSPAEHNSWRHMSNTVGPVYEKLKEIHLIQHGDQYVQSEHYSV